MKKLLISAVLLLCAAPAFAGVDILWTRCSQSSTTPGTVDMLFDCTDPSFFADAYATFQSPEAIPGGNLVALEFALDLQVDAAVLPPFYMYDVCGTMPSITHIKPANTVCSATNWYGLGGADGDNARTYVSGVGGPNRGRFSGATFRPIDNPHPTAIVANQNIWAFGFKFFVADATEAGGGCAGCPTAWAMVLNEIRVGVLNGAAGGASPEARLIPVNGPGLISNCATSGGAASICAATPTKNKTWGALKSLYR